MKILVTNDDSHRSPLLDFLLTYFRSKAEVTFVLPAHEQSWKGKSITRFEPLHVEPLELFGVKGWTVDGTPADCGISFILSSGTVGACFEANIAGIPAIALSQHFEPGVHRHYIAEYALPDEVSTHLRAQTEITLEIVERGLLQQAVEHPHPITWNVNFPSHLQDAENMWFAKPGQSFYHRLFEQKDSRLTHNLSEYTADTDPEADISRLRDGKISVTPFDIRCFGETIHLDSQTLSRQLLAR
jgi:5'-nucleotidase